MDHVKLKNSTGSFRDPQTGLTVVRDGLAELREPVGALTRQWLVAGGLVRVNEQPSPDAPSAGGDGTTSTVTASSSPVEEAPKPAEAAPIEVKEAPPEPAQEASNDETVESEDAEPEEEEKISEEDLRKMPMGTLRKIAKGLGVTLQRTDNADSIVGKILTAQG